MHILPVLQELLPSDIVTEICEKWIHPDVFFCFGMKDPAPHFKRWKVVFRNFILANHQARKDIHHLVSLSCRWKYACDCLMSLRDIVGLAIEHNHLMSVHLLLDAHPELASSQYAEPLFWDAVRHNRPHLLRLLPVLWKFELSITYLHSCMEWMQHSDRFQSHSQCRRECEMLISSR